MARHKRRGSFSKRKVYSKKRRGHVGKGRSSRSSRKKFINRVTISRGGIRL